VDRRLSKRDGVDNVAADCIDDAGLFRISHVEANDDVAMIGAVVGMLSEGLQVVNRRFGSSRAAQSKSPGPGVVSLRSNAV